MPRVAKAKVTETENPPEDSIASRMRTRSRASAAPPTPAPKAAATARKPAATKRQTKAEKEEEPEPKAEAPAKKTTSRRQAKTEEEPEPAPKTAITSPKATAKRQTVTKRQAKAEETEEPEPKAEAPKKTTARRQAKAEEVPEPAPKAAATARKAPTKRQAKAEKEEDEPAPKTAAENAAAEKTTAKRQTKAEKEAEAAKADVEEKKPRGSRQVKVAESEKPPEDDNAGTRRTRSRAPATPAPKAQRKTTAKRQTKAEKEAEAVAAEESQNAEQEGDTKGKQKAKPSKAIKEPAVDSKPLPTSESNEDEVKPENDQEPTKPVQADGKEPVADSIDSAPAPIAQSAEQTDDTKNKQEPIKSLHAAVKRPVADWTPPPIPQPKRLKKDLVSVVTRPHISGTVMSCGEDSSGELGFKSVGATKRRPADIGLSEKFSMVVAGSMHSFAISSDGKKIYSFGCNDESALGRSTATNGDISMTDLSLNETTEEITTEMLESTPMVVSIPSTSVVKITAGDSHSAALTEIGALYCWGCFRDQNGKIGIDVKQTSPTHTYVPFMPMPYEVTISDMSSGDNHLLLLTNDGKVYSFGQAEQGQLGRVPQAKTKFNNDEKELYLTPKQVLIDGRDDIECDRIWAATFRSFVRTTNGRIFAWGLNNYCQLGFQTRMDSNGAQMLIEYAPIEITDQFPRDTIIESIVGGTHHTLALDSEGNVYAWGRHHYGRLGLGEIDKEQNQPTLVEALKDEKVIQICCGGDSSFAITADGKLFSWGMGSVHLGHSMPDDDINSDIWKPKLVTSKKLTESKAKFLAASSGSSHLLTIVTRATDSENGN